MTDRLPQPDGWPQKTLCFFQFELFKNSYAAVQCIQVPNSTYQSWLAASVTQLLLNCPMYKMACLPSGLDEIAVLSYFDKQINLSPRLATCRFDYQMS
jgi:hypothetical protein